jgi:hypothetical protein
MKSSLSSPERQRLNNQAHDIVQRRIAEQEEENMRQLRKRARIVYHPQHVLDFKCQCKSCVRKHTITMEDRDLLREMGITWNKAEEDGVQTTLDENPVL